MKHLLTTREIARFVAGGFLELPAIVPAPINEQLCAEVAAATVPEVPGGTPIAEAYPPATALGRLFALPEVQGIITSLVGPDPVVDHHAVHVVPPSPVDRTAAQHWHQDSTIDTRQAFDIQLMWYPHEVSADMGGTRYLPGSHLRIVNEFAVARYQNIVGQRHVVCPAGTLLIVHHGIWHGGGVNRSDRPRTMFKVRLNATRRQTRLWDLGDLSTGDLRQRPAFWAPSGRAPDDLHEILLESQPWYEEDTARLEFINRIRLFRYLLDDDTFDADYWLSRLEAQPGRRIETASGVDER